MFRARAAENEGVNYKKLIALLVGLCVLLAPVLSNAAVYMPAAVVHTQDHHADCHSVKAVDCHETQMSGHSTTTKATHSCCFNFVAILATTRFIESSHSSSEFIPFNPSMSLSSRVEGLYRPPRQLS